MKRTHRTHAAATLILASCLPLFSVAEVPEADDPLGFLDTQDAAHAWVIDSGFDPGAFYGLTFDPPWRIGTNALTRIGLAGAPQILSTTPLGNAGSVMTFALSPDGDTALVSTLLPNQILVVRGLRQDLPQVTATLPVALFPLSFDFAPDGRSAAAGLQRNGPGTAQIARIVGLPETPAIGEAVDLGAHANVLSAVESVDWSRDGRRILVQTALHQHPAPPLFFLPEIAMQVLALDDGNAQVSAPLILPAEPFLRPRPPFEELLTGVAIGDSVILCDGDTALVGSTGALNLGQRDARLLFLRGVRAGSLVVERILTLDDGVGVAPFQVTVGPDCAAWVTNTFDGSVTRVGGLLVGDFGAIELRTFATSYPFPGEPAATSDGRRLLVHHPRAPRNGVPPAAVTVWDPPDDTAVGSPLTGPVTAWIEVKDATLAAQRPGLLDYLRALSTPERAAQFERLIGHVRRAIDFAAGGHSPAARAELLAFRNQVEFQKNRGMLAEAEARLFTDLAVAGQQALEPQPPRPLTPDAILRRSMDLDTNASPRNGDYRFK